MRIKFTKMHGLGNDFMIVRWPPELPLPDPELVIAWADRRTGVGYDSLLVLTAPTSEAAAAAYRVFNADGSEVEQCGNGARCLASFLADEAGREFTLESAAGPVEVRVLGAGFASVNLGEPRFEPEALPFTTTARSPSYRLALSDGEVEFGIASMGNPHAVIEVDSVETAPVGILGAELNAHRDFPRGVNVGFMQRLSESRIRLRVFERGVGETRACGTGAAAAVAVGRMRKDLADTVEVQLMGGSLTVAWPGPGLPLWQTGPTTEVYEGQIVI
jgi:diaminopimelate epimerase